MKLRNIFNDSFWIWLALTTFMVSVFAVALVFGTNIGVLMDNDNDDDYNYPSTVQMITVDNIPRLIRVFSDDYALRAEKVYDVSSQLTITENHNLWLIGRAKCIIATDSDGKMSVYKPKNGFMKEQTNNPKKNFFEVPVDETILYASTSGCEMAARKPFYIITTMYEAKSYQQSIIFQSININLDAVALYISDTEVIDIMVVPFVYNSFFERVVDKTIDDSDTTYTIQTDTDYWAIYSEKDGSFAFFEREDNKFSIPLEKKSTMLIMFCDYKDIRTCHRTVHRIGN